MSKRKDRLNTDFRYCPICSSKAIFIRIERGLLWKKQYIICHKCRSKTLVKEVIWKI